jgi:hypothetical protein
MAGCAMQTWNNVREAAWECIKRKAAQYGVIVTVPRGCASKDGFTFCWDYVQARGLLSIQCTDAPWWALCSVIHRIVDEQVQGCLWDDNSEVTQIIEMP